jgi:hypothetical protein
MTEVVAMRIRHLRNAYRGVQEDEIDQDQSAAD